MNPEKIILTDNVFKNKLLCLFEEYESCLRKMIIKMTKNKDWAI